ncbi:MAG: MarR family winged helix-turn-helix transcriptional regulator [Candidatus Altiarchaeota archaeon]
MNSIGALDIFFAAAAIAFYLHYLYFKKQNTLRIALNGLSYDRGSGRLELCVENTGDKTYFIKPELRLARLTPADEWKEQTTNGNGLEMMEGKAGNGYSVIKGYDLLGYHESPVPVSPGESKKLVYFVTRDVDINTCDNVKVDLSYGLESALMDNTVECNMTVKFNDVEADDAPLDSAGDFLDDILEIEDDFIDHDLIPDVPLDGGFDEPAVEAALDGGIVEQVIEVPLDGSLDDEPSVKKELKQSSFPIEATCFCCGKKQWLKWVFESQHVCEECKVFLSDKYGIAESERLELSAGQLEIVHLLRRDGGVGLTAIAGKLGRSKYVVDKNIKVLLDGSHVVREKSGRGYIYYLNE